MQFPGDGFDNRAGAGRRHECVLLRMIKKREKQLPRAYHIFGSARAGTTRQREREGVVAFSGTSQQATRKGIIVFLGTSQRATRKGIIVFLGTSQRASRKHTVFLGIAMTSKAQQIHAGHRSMKDLTTTRYQQSR